jgi:hypothetical protein
VTKVKRNVALLAGAAAGAVGAFVLRRRRSVAAGASGADPRAEELRRKLAQAREAAADADDFEAAGMGPETLVEEEPSTAGPPADVDEERRRVHDEARAAADEMRRGDGPEAA